MLLGHRAPVASALRFRPNLECLEGRWVLASYTLTPVVPVIDAAMEARLSEVMQRGAALGNQANVFARAGDSITYASSFLVPLGTPSVGADNAGDGSLNETLNYFRSGKIGADNSFTHASLAALGGWTSANVRDALSGELAASKPAFVLVMVGTNDITAGTPLAAFRENLTTIVRTALDAGVVPVLSTIPDYKLFPEFGQRQPSYNQVIQDVGEALQIPVWNYWRALQRLPDSGISADGIHPSVSPSGGSDLSETGLLYGYNVRNLTALQTLDKLRRVLTLDQQPDLISRNANWAPLTNALAVAAGDSTGFQVQVIDAKTRTGLFGFDPFPGFGGGVRVALGDVTRDGVPDLIATPGPGGPPHVKVFDGKTGALLSSFLAFDAGLRSGLSVATGDVNGDGRAEIVVTPETNAAAHVKVFTGAGQLLNSFLAFPAAFVGGARVASADVDRDGFADVVVAAGKGGRGHIVAFSVAGQRQLASYLPFGATFGGSVSIAVGDLDGDGEVEIAVGAASTATAPHVKVFRALTGETARSFYAYPGFLGGVRLTTVDRGNGYRELVTMSNTTAVADLRVWDVTRDAVRDVFFLYGVGFRRGGAFGG